MCPFLIPTAIYVTITLRERKTEGERERETMNLRGDRSQDSLEGGEVI